MLFFRTGSSSGFAERFRAEPLGDSEGTTGGEAESRGTDRLPWGPRRGGLSSLPKGQAPPRTSPCPPRSTEVI
jgi:hypothetical protein